MTGNDELPGEVRRGLEQLPSWSPAGFDAAVGQRASGKLVRRRRFAVAGSTALVLAVVGGGIGVATITSGRHGDSVAALAAPTHSFPAASTKAGSSQPAGSAATAKSASATTTVKSAPAKQVTKPAAEPGGPVVGVLPRGKTQLPDGLAYVRQRKDTSEQAAGPYLPYLKPLNDSGPLLGFIAGTVGERDSTIEPVNGANDFLSLPGRWQPDGEPAIAARVAVAEYASRADTDATVADAFDQHGNRPFSRSDNMKEITVPGLTEKGIRVFSSTNHSRPTGGDGKLVYYPALTAFKVTGSWIVSIELNAEGLKNPKRTLTTIMNAMVTNLDQSGLAK
ncbi:hypothetical protein [Nakamurella lactea]|uniref:hypothetical protein n=1 Tax=Nakamurella lactea TaxID=459515 RepID=UPI000421BA99|nr:hypothetical protein [Nakamurella lactea]